MFNFHGPIYEGMLFRWVNRDTARTTLMAAVRASKAGFLYGGGGSRRQPRVFRNVTLAV
jgi:hypothetical protein